MHSTSKTEERFREWFLDSVGLMRDTEGSLRQMVLDMMRTPGLNERSTRELETLLDTIELVEGSIDLLDKTARSGLGRLFGERNTGQSSLVRLVRNSAA